MGRIQASELKQVSTWYYQDKLTANQIAEQLGVSIDAVYYFMRHNGLVRRTLGEENALRFSRKNPSFVIREVLTSEEQQLKALGIGIYWGEGAKSGHCLDFANSDAGMVAVFMRFLRTIFKLDEAKFRIYLYCFANQNVEALIDFWSGVTNIPKKMFFRPYVRQDFRADKSGKMPHGLIHVRYYDKKLLHLVLSWIKDVGVGPY